MANYITDEIKKCLKCRNASCRKACPVDTPINEIMQYVMENKIYEAGELLFDNNPLSVVCSLICPHELQCEGNCVLGIKGSPVKIGAIEHYISDYYLNFPTENPPMQKKERVAIIGSGPAGITIAFCLAKKGYDITIFEAHDKIGGVLRYGIPEFRLPKTFLEKLKKKLLDYGVKVRPNTLIGQIITIDDLFRDGYKAIFIGTGVWRPNTLNVKGESLGHVHYAIDYLKNPDVYTLGNRVCIIGAGNVAVDVARTAIRYGCREVTILYHKGPDEITALRHEVEYARLDGVKFEFYKAPIEFVDKGVKDIETEVSADENGNEIISRIENTEGMFEADSIIVAISQGPRNYIVSNTTGLEAHRNGLVVTDNFGRTTRSGVFAGGDVVTGSKTVVEAVKWAKKVADAIDDYVINNPQSQF
jgi:glutamate synthase (NADPH/NADH) small chain